MAEWFGKNCKWQSCQWEWCEVYAYRDSGNPYGYKDSEPVLIYCSHPDVMDVHEGNCKPEKCPLSKLK